MNDVISALNQIADAWFGHLVSSGWQASLVAVLVIGIALLGQRISAPLRYALLLLALVKFVIPPMLPSPIDIPHFGVVVPPDHIGALPRIETSDASSAQQTSTPSPLLVTAKESSAPLGQAPDQAYAGPSQSVRRSAEPASRILEPLTALLLTYTLGVFVILGAAIVRMRRLRQIVSHGVQPSDRTFELFKEAARLIRLKRVPHVLVSLEAQTPFCAGALRPTVIVPRSVEESLTPDELRMVLLHELVHHKRCDLWAIWLQLAVTTLWWFHPPGVGSQPPHS